MYLRELPNSYVDGRGFSGDDEYSPGPIGYSGFSGFKAIDTVQITMFPLNQWLSDGLLVSSISDLAVWVFDLIRSSSCTVAT